MQNFAVNIIKPGKGQFEFWCIHCIGIICEQYFASTYRFGSY